MGAEALKEAAAKAALSYIEDDMVVGVGTGSTTNYFIDGLAGYKHIIQGAIASSEATAQLLKALSIPILDLNAISEIDIYVDGADEVNADKLMIKGGGGAATREKLVSCVAKKFICIVHQDKKVNVLGAFPIAVEVLPMARSLAARHLVKLGGSPEYRVGVTTDNGNILLDVFGLDLSKPIALEEQINNIPGVVGHGLFAKRRADDVLVATTGGVETY